MTATVRRGGPDGIAWTYQLRRVVRSYQRVGSDQLVPERERGGGGA